LANEGEGPVKLIDFGMATSQRMHHGAPRGKPSYIAPEVHGEDGYDAFQADVFSCGVILYCLALRDYPWMSTRPGQCKCFDFVRKHGFNAYIAKRQMPIGTDRIPTSQVLSEELASLLSGLLEVDPARRLSLHGNVHPSIWTHPWLQDGVRAEELQLVNQQAN